MTSTQRIVSFTERRRRMTKKVHVESNYLVW